MLHATWFSLALCLAFLTPSTLSLIVSSASTSDVSLIVFFSFVWGLGTFGFGLSVQVAGIGMGTTLTMSVIVLVGTLLPLLLDVNGKLLTKSGGLILLGLAICGASFASASVALRRKDRDELEAEEAALTNVTNVKEVELGGAAVTENTAEISPAAAPYTSSQKVLVCVISGFFCATLQFAFVFSAGMRDSAENQYGVSSVLSPAVTFVFAIPICAFTNALISFTVLARRGALEALWKNGRAIEYGTKAFCFIAAPW